ncbi:MAG: hypothetical protein ACFE9L_05195 [Candidatus Hodarchaeota archaeon]
MQQNKEPDLLCEIRCRSFRCSERYLKVIRKQSSKGTQKQFLCKMVEGDECIGYKCKYTICTYRPPALDVTTGICALKKKKIAPKQVRKEYARKSGDDPLEYRKLLDKKMRKNFKIKDFY